VETSTTISIVSIVISAAVACAVVYREFIHDWLFHPKLEIAFSLEEPISRETILINDKRGFWPRLRVTNNGRSAARRCEGILAEVRMPDGTLDKRYDPLTLRWAIAPIDKGLQPLDIARGRQVDLNIFTTIESASAAQFATYADPRGIPLFLEPGEYWLRIIIYGDNFKPVERGYAVHWDGKDYRKGIHIQEMNDKPTSTTVWPWQGEGYGTPT
jgi:hypothetical protein